MSWWTSANLHPKTKNRFVVVFSNAFYLPNVKSISKPEVQIETKEYRLLNHTFNYPGNAKWQPVTVKFVDMNGAGENIGFFDTSQFLWQMLNNTGYAYPHFDESAIRDPTYRNLSTNNQVEGKGHHISTKVAFRDDPRTDAEEFKTWRTITTPEKSSNIANSFGLGLQGEVDMLPAGVSRQRVAIYQISPDEIINEAWYLVNPIVKNIKWGDLAYEDDALIEYELQIVYDWAILDRQMVGELLVIDEEPYKFFMKTLDNNRSAIDQEISDRTQIDRLRESIQDMEAADLDILKKDLQSDQPEDLNNDGVISDEELALWNPVKNKEGEIVSYEATDQLTSLQQQVDTRIEEQQAAEDYLRSAKFLFPRVEDPEIPEVNLGTTYDVEAGSGGLGAGGGGLGGGGTIDMTEMQYKKSDQGTNDLPYENQDFYTESRDRDRSDLDKSINEQQRATAPSDVDVFREKIKRGPSAPTQPSENIKMPKTQFNANSSPSEPSVLSEQEAYIRQRYAEDDKFIEEYYKDNSDSNDSDSNR